MDQAIREKAEALLAADPTLGRERLAKELNISEGVTRTMLKKLESAVCIQTKGTPSVSAGKSLTDFRQQFDISLRIREGLSKLNGVYMTDSEFRQFCNIPTSHWRQYADQDEFKKFRGKFPGGQLLWAKESMMIEMKRIAGIMEDY